ncbi:MAG: hypothetical protein ACFFBP_03065 [Promethearchaeota archaeon]
MAPKFNISDSERLILVCKVVPTLFIGSVIWLISELIFGTVFTRIIIPGEIFFAIYIPMNIANVILFIFFYFICRKGNIILSILLYFLFAFCAGIIIVPISNMTVLDQGLRIYVHAFVSLAMGGTAIVLILALVLKDRYFNKDYLWSNLIIFGLGLLTMSIVFIVIYQITNYILIIISIVVLIIIALLVMFYGASLTKKVKEEYWMVIVFRVLASLLLFSFLVLLVLIIILLAIASEGNLDLSGLGGWSSGSKRKEKKVNPMYKE